MSGQDQITWTRPDEVVVEVDCVYVGFNEALGGDVSEALRQGLAALPNVTDVFVEGGFGFELRANDVDQLDALKDEVEKFFDRLCAA